MGNTFEDFLNELPDLDIAILAYAIETFNTQETTNGLPALVNRTNEMDEAISKEYEKRNLSAFDFFTLFDDVSCFS